MDEVHPPKPPPGLLELGSFTHRVHWALLRRAVPSRRGDLRWDFPEESLEQITRALNRLVRLGWAKKLPEFQYVAEVVDESYYGYGRGRKAGLQQERRERRQAAQLIRSTQEAVERQARKEAEEREKLKRQEQKEAKKQSKLKHQEQEREAEAARATQQKVLLCSERELFSAPPTTREWLARQEKWEDTVYFAEAREVGRVKIGWTKHPPHTTDESHSRALFVDRVVVHARNAGI